MLDEGINLFLRARVFGARVFGAPGFWGTGFFGAPGQRSDLALSCMKESCWIGFQGKPVFDGLCPQVLGRFGTI